MESTREDAKLFSKTEMSPSTLEKQHDIIFISTAQRTRVQILTTIAVTDSVYHVIHIIILFFSSTVLWKQAHLNSQPDRALYHAIHSNLDSVLGAEVGVFLFAHLVRQVFAACDAVSIQQKWMREEETGRKRTVAFVLLVANVVVTTVFIFWPLLSDTDVGKQRRLCTATYYG